MVRSTSSEAKNSPQDLQPPSSSSGKTDIPRASPKPSRPQHPASAHSKLSWCRHDHGYRQAGKCFPLGPEDRTTSSETGMKGLPRHSCTRAGMDISWSVIITPAPANGAALRAPPAIPARSARNFQATTRPHPNRARDELTLLPDSHILQRC